MVVGGWEGDPLPHTLQGVSHHTSLLSVVSQLQFVSYQLVCQPAAVCQLSVRVQVIGSYVRKGCCYTPLRYVGEEDETS